jgi:polyhydroxybutyrate depolymerase
MLHGTSGDGLRFYNISGWKELGEKEGILTIFPSSMEYCIVEEGKMKRTTKWNTYRSDWDFCANETGQNDIDFLRTVLYDLKKRLRYDEKSVYLAGFSNGGQMASQCSFEMGLYFAAITANSGAIVRDTVFQVARNMPVMLQFGNMEGPLPGFNNGEPFPLSRFPYLLDSTTVFSNIISTYTKSFDLSPKYTLSGDTNKFVIATFPTLNPGLGHEMQIRLVNMMDHLYPNGTNHPLKGAEEQRKWMQRFRLP